MPKPDKSQTPNTVSEFITKLGYETEAQNMSIAVITLLHRIADRLLRENLCREAEASSVLTCDYDKALCMSSIMCDGKIYRVDVAITFKASVKEAWMVNEVV
jgi:hypothetical protein